MHDRRPDLRPESKLARCVRTGRRHVDDLSRSTREQIDAVNGERDQLAAQVRQSQKTTARASTLIERLDGTLAKLDSPTAEIVFEPCPPQKE
jgi:septal ring factor EnvC (AmiA/AmiB activator)